MKQTNHDKYNQGSCTRTFQQSAGNLRYLREWRRQSSNQSVRASDRLPRCPDRNKSQFFTMYFLLMFVVSSSVSFQMIYFALDYLREGSEDTVSVSRDCQAPKSKSTTSTWPTENEKTKGREGGRKAIKERIREERKRRIITQWHYCNNSYWEPLATNSKAHWSPSSDYDERSTSWEREEGLPMWNSRWCRSTNTFLWSVREEGRRGGERGRLKRGREGKYERTR